jgi:CHAD domain-containing protein/CYTH domain-containing protein
MPPRVDNLRESTHRAVRLVALGHLADASAARDRLKSSSDHEALHDFRVALRRLRSWERAFRPYLRGDLSKKLRRRLRSVAGDTGASRDLEVHLSWLVEQRRSLGRRQRPGLSWILANLRQQKTEADSLLAHDVGGRFGRLESKLRKALETYRDRVRLRDDGSAAQPPAFADALAPRVRDAAGDLRDHLERVQSAADQRDCHEARISAKRLRYLLEPVARSVRGASDVVERLKSMQDVLGDLHDAQVFGAEISELATEAARVTAPDAEVVRSNGGSRRVEPREDVPESTVNPAPADASPETPGEPVATPSAESEEAQTVVIPTRNRAPALLAPAVDPLPGIMALSDRLRDRATAAFAQFTAEWLGEQSAAFFRDTDAVADRIAEAARAGVEIERKFLLHQLPAEARAGRRLDIDQGYIPGDQLHERIRRVSIRHGIGRLEVHYYRTVKLGEGVARTEIEEETTQAIFDVLWPLTRRRRLRKRRYEVDADGVTWEIDDFKHRDLVLAEIELENEDDEVAFPDWLAPVIQREVTKDPEFQNINLAR